MSAQRFDERNISISLTAPLPIVEGKFDERTISISLAPPVEPYYRLVVPPWLEAEVPEPIELQRLWACILKHYGIMGRRGYNQIIAEFGSICAFIDEAVERGYFTDWTRIWIKCPDEKKAVEAFCARMEALMEALKGRFDERSISIALRAPPIPQVYDERSIAIALRVPIPIEERFDERSISIALEVPPYPPPPKPPIPPVIPPEEVISWEALLSLGVTGLALILIKKGIENPEKVKEVVQEVIKLGPDFFIMGALGVHSHSVLKGPIGGLASAIYGPLAYKLATTPTYGGEVKIAWGAIEIPINAQTIGMLMLSGLGLIDILRLLGGQYDLARVHELVKKAQEHPEDLTDEEFKEIIMLH